MTSRRKFLLKVLAEVQAHPVHSYHDIQTIASCGMTDDELAAHVHQCNQQIDRKLSRER